MFEYDNNFLNNFLDMIDISNKYNYENAKIETEYMTNNGRRIDILITGNNHAIIVENKLNYAHDLENQLHDYYVDIKSKNFEIDKVIYISPTIYKQPSEYTYGNKKNDIEKKLKIIYGCLLDNKDNETKDLYKCLEKYICKMTNDDDGYLTFCKHYLEILKKIGSGSMNDEERIRENFLQEINKNDDKDIGKKLSYMKDMLNSLHRARVEFFIRKFKGEGISSDAYWHGGMHVAIIVPLDLSKMDIETETRIYIDIQSFEETKLFIENHAEDKQKHYKYNEIIKDFLDSKKINNFELKNWDGYQEYFRFEQTFVFLKNDDDIVKLVVGLYKSLNFS